MSHTWRNDETKTLADWLAREGKMDVLEIVEAVIQNDPSPRLEILTLLADQIQTLAKKRWLEGMNPGTLRDLVAISLARADWKALAGHWLIRVKHGKGGEEWD